MCLFIYHVHVHVGNETSHIYAVCLCRINFHCLQIIRTGGSAYANHFLVSNRIRMRSSFAHHFHPLFRLQFICFARMLCMCVCVWVCNGNAHIHTSIPLNRSRRFPSDARKNKFIAWFNLFYIFFSFPFIHSFRSIITLEPKWRSTWIHHRNSITIFSYYFFLLSLPLPRHSVGSSGSPLNNGAVNEWGIKWNTFFFFVPFIAKSENSSIKISIIIRNSCDETAAKIEFKSR